MVERRGTIRSLIRGIAVLTEINRNGPLNMSSIAKATKLSYATAYRVVTTLMHDGFVELEPHRKFYRATSLVHMLSSGYQSEDRLVQAARPHIEQLCREFGWPVAIATRVGTRMMIRDSTHHMTTLTFENYYPGYTLPITECASGKVQLAFCSSTERDAVRLGLTEINRDEKHQRLALLGDDFVLARIANDGFASHVRNAHTAHPHRTSSIAVPIFERGEHLAGALTLVYFSKAMRSREAERRYLRNMLETSAAISRDLDEICGSARAPTPRKNEVN